MKFSGLMAPGGAFASPIAENGLDDDRDGPGVFGALQSQLGSRLIEKKLSLDVLVVDHADKSANRKRVPGRRSSGLPID